MDKEKLTKLLSDEKFMKKVVEMKSAEEIQAEFKKEGLEISLDEVDLLGEIINKSVGNDGKPLSEDELSEISGGSSDEEDLAIVTLLSVGLGVSATLLAAQTSISAAAIGVVQWARKKKK